ncbi:MAG: metalloregulator ArsR/SmtB family transcription factor [Balneolaceae bacterium]
MDTQQQTVNRRAIQIKAKLFRGFSDPSRLSIIEALRDGRKSVGELVESTGLTQPNVSNHLRCLSDCDLVRNVRKGRHIYYRLSDERIHSILDQSEQLLSDVAKGVYECTRYEVTGTSTAESTS